MLREGPSEGWRGRSVRRKVDVSATVRLVRRKKSRTNGRVGRRCQMERGEGRSVGVGVGHVGRKEVCQQGVRDHDLR